MSFSGFFSINKVFRIRIWYFICRKENSSLAQSKNNLTLNLKKNRSQWKLSIYFFLAHFKYTFVFNINAMSSTDSSWNAILFFFVFRAVLYCHLQLYNINKVFESSIGNIYICNIIWCFAFSTFPCWPTLIS